MGSVHVGRRKGVSRKPLPTSYADLGGDDVEQGLAGNGLAFEGVGNGLLYVDGGAGINTGPGDAQALGQVARRDDSCNRQRKAVRHLEQQVPECFDI